mmetsp:Transcript_99055/g.206480  ORF Transcript_99055/g.206480 Transcript_99055/m.206480 type:complete len:386 (+) Transcript_99055:2-1159(+)
MEKKEEKEEEEEKQREGEEVKATEEAAAGHAAGHAAEKEKEEKREEDKEAAGKEAELEDEEKVKDEKEPDHPQPTEEAPRPPNLAFLFIEPQAVTERVRQLVKQRLADHGLQVEDEGSIDGQQIEEQKLVEKHFARVAAKAIDQFPEQFVVPNDKFEEKFGLPWKEALLSGRALNAEDACKHLGFDAEQLADEWDKAKEQNLMLEISRDLACAQIEVEGTSRYVFNGHYLALRSRYTRSGASIYFYSVKWDPDMLSWLDFQQKVIGSPNPSEAQAMSLRSELYSSFEALGLPAPPSIGETGLHCSLSPFEGMHERHTWLGAPISSDPFGEAVLGAGVTEEKLQKWFKNPKVKTKAGNVEPIFEALEDLDSDACLEKLVEFSVLNS